jgi:hypothetical protein
MRVAFKPRVRPRAVSILWASFLSAFFDALADVVVDAPGASAVLLVALSVG